MITVRFWLIKHYRNLMTQTLTMDILVGLTVKNIQFLFPILNTIGVKNFTIWGSFTDNHYFDELISQAKDSNIMLDYKGAYSRENFGEISTSIDVFLMPTLAENFATIFWKRILWEWRFLFLKKQLLGTVSLINYIIVKIFNF